MRAAAVADDEADAANATTASEQEAAAEVQAHFRRLQAAKARRRHASYAVIPAFHSGGVGTKQQKPPPPQQQQQGKEEAEEEAEAEVDATEHEDLRRRFRLLARQRFLRRREGQLLNAQVCQFCPGWMVRMVHFGSIFQTSSSHNNTHDPHTGYGGVEQATAGGALPAGCLGS